LIFMITFKLMFFMQVSENYASLVTLVSNVIVKIKPFTNFFFMW